MQQHGTDMHLWFVPCIGEPEETLDCPHAAAWHGHALVVRAIVEAIEDEAFDEQDNKERTTLHLAAIRGILCASKNSSV